MQPAAHVGCTGCLVLNSPESAVLVLGVFICMTQSDATAFLSTRNSLTALTTATHTRFVLRGNEAIAQNAVVSEQRFVLLGAE